MTYTNFLLQISIKKNTFRNKIIQKMKDNIVIKPLLIFNPELEILTK